MGLLDDAIEETAKRQYPVCSLSLLSDDLRDEIETALEHVSAKTITAVGLSKALANRGIRLSASTLNRHRRGLCTCESD